MRRTGQATRDRLSRLDTCAISDALDRLGISGVAPALHRVAGAGPIVASVATIQLEPADGARSARHLGTAVLDGLTAGEAIVVANGGRTDAGAWGGLLSRAARLCEAAGVLVDGAVRDVDEIDALGVPVYGRAVVPLSARGRFVETGHQEPVEVQGIRVAPGDVVVADGTGAVFIPRARVGEVLETAEELFATERDMVRALEAGGAPSRVMGGNYEALTRHDG
ncbi:MAG: RraA family protein [Gemmatimonadota bacterium]